MSQVETEIEKGEDSSPQRRFPPQTEQVPASVHLSQLSLQMQLTLLGAAFVAGLVLYFTLPGAIYFIAATLALIALVATTFVANVRPSNWLIGSTVALMHVGWIVFALHYTGYLNSPLLPLLYVVVAIYSMYGRDEQTGVVVAGAVVALLVQAFMLGMASSEVLLTVASHAILLTAVSWTVNKYVGWLYEAHNSAEQQAHTYRRMTEAADDALLVLDPHWKVTQLNSAAASLLGNNGDRPDLTGKSLLEILDLHHPEAIEQYQKQIDQGQIVSDIPLIAQLPKGGRREMLFTALPIIEDDRVTAIHAAIRDITELSHYRQEVKHLEKFVAVRHVLTSLGHSLNNPLAIIRLASQVSKAIGEEPDWDEIVRQVDRCRTAIRGLEIYTTGRADEASVADVNEVLDQALLLTTAHLMITGVQFEQDVPPNLPPIHADRHSLHHSFVNVVTYAWQHMDDWPGQRKLAIEGRRCQEGVEIRFRCTGPSIQPGQIPELLRGPSAAKESPADFNEVSLADVYSTVRQAGGQILVSPNRREGGVLIRIILRSADKEEIAQYETSRGV